MKMNVLMECLESIMHITWAQLCDLTQLSFMVMTALVSDCEIGIILTYMNALGALV